MNLMMDLETLGTTPDTAVISLGCVLFDLKGKIIATRYFKFDVQDQLDRGRSVSIDTINWWMNQSAEARLALVKSPEDMTLKYFKREFLLWLKENGAQSFTLRPWGNGATFDVSIMENILGPDAPWKFWNVMCYRTYDKINKIKDLVKREGVYHNALDDAKHQTNCLLEHWAQTKKTV
jgi:hypothetical protein